MTRSKIFPCLAALAMLLVSLPAQAHASRHHHFRHHRTCGALRRARGNRGTAIGAVGGGVVGNVASGGKLGGTLIGAGAGAVIGHHIAKSGTRC